MHMNPVGASRTFMNPSRSMTSSTPCCALPAGIHRVARRRAPRTAPASCLRRHARSRPVLALERIDARGDVAVGHGASRNAASGVKPMSASMKNRCVKRGLARKIGDAIVAAACHQAVSSPQVELKRHPDFHAGALQLKDAEDVIETEPSRRSKAWRRAAESPSKP